MRLTQRTDTTQIGVMFIYYCSFTVSNIYSLVCIVQQLRNVEHKCKALDLQGELVISKLQLLEQLAVVPHNSSLVRLFGTALRKPLKMIKFIFLNLFLQSKPASNIKQLAHTHVRHDISTIQKGL